MEFTSRAQDSKSKNPSSKDIGLKLMILSHLLNGS